VVYSQWLARAVLVHIVVMVSWCSREEEIVSRGAKGQVADN